MWLTVQHLSVLPLCNLPVYHRISFTGKSCATQKRPQLTWCAVLTPVQFVFWFSRWVISRGGTYIFRVAYSRGEPLQCGRGYSVGRICFSCRESWIDRFSSLYVSSKFQLCVLKMCESFYPLESLCATIPCEGSASTKVWTILIIFIYFEARVPKLCFLTESSQLSPLWSVSKVLIKKNKTLRLVSIFL